jgi:putative spermidine/putrescine transport system ATP-binding protein
MQIELRHLHQRLGTTVIYVTHDQREALTLSDRIAVIDRGRIQQIDTPQRLYEAPASHFVADFIGDSTFLEVTVADGVARWRDQTLKPGRTVADGAYLLVLRPEKLMLGGDAAGLNALDADVAEVVYQGESVRIDLRLAGGEVVSLREAARAGRIAAMPALGERVRLALDPADTLLVPAP